MAKVKVGLQFVVDQTSKKTVEDSFKKLTDNAKNLSNIKVGVDQTSIKEAQAAIEKFKNALNDAISENGSINTVQFNREMNAAYGSAENFRSKIKVLGKEGAEEMQKIASAVRNLKTTYEKTGTVIDKVKSKILHAAAWQYSNAAVNAFNQALSGTYQYVQDLDKSLNDIRIVTEKSANDMEKFAKQANYAAQALGKTTTDYTEGSLIYYQAGLSDEEVTARTDATLKAANVTQQSTSAVAEQLMAVWNGFQVAVEDTEKAVDKLAAIGAASASDLEELATGMSKVASAANNMGITEDQLGAMLGTVISATREDASSIGTSFKTIFARMSDIESGIDEDGTTLGSYSADLQKYGIEVLDVNNNLRNMGEVIEEVGEKWQTLSRTQQVGLSQVLGGTRQYSRVMSLFENWDEYERLLKISQESEGTLQTQQDIYMDSTQAHLDAATAAMENFQDSLLDADTINFFADAVKNLSNTIATLLDAVGGGKGLLLNLIPLLTNLFKTDISKNVANQIKLIQAIKEERKNNDSAEIATFQQYTSAGYLTREEQIRNNKENLKRRLSEEFGGEIPKEVEKKLDSEYRDLLKDAENQREEVTKLIESTNIDYVKQIYGKYLSGESGTDTIEDALKTAKELYNYTREGVFGSIEDEGSIINDLLNPNEITKAFFSKDVDFESTEENLNEALNFLYRVRDVFGNEEFLGTDNATGQTVFSQFEQGILEQLDAVRKNTEEQEKVNEEVQKTKTLQEKINELKIKQEETADKFDKAADMSYDAGPFSQEELASSNKEISKLKSKIGFHLRKDLKLEGATSDDYTKEDILKLLSEGKITQGKSNFITGLYDKLDQAMAKNEAIQDKKKYAQQAEDAYEEYFVLEKQIKDTEAEAKKLNDELESPVNITATEEIKEETEAKKENTEATKENQKTKEKAETKADTKNIKENANALDSETESKKENTEATRENQQAKEQNSQETQESKETTDQSTQETEENTDAINEETQAIKDNTEAKTENQNVSKGIDAVINVDNSAKNKEIEEAIKKNSSKANVEKDTKTNQNTIDFANEYKKMEVGLSGLTSAFSALSSGAAVLSNINTLVKNIGDESISTGDKFTLAFTSIISTGGQVVSAISQTGSAIKNLKEGGKDLANGLKGVWGIVTKFLTNPTYLMITGVIAGVTLLSVAIANQKTELQKLEAELDNLETEYDDLIEKQQEFNSLLDTYDSKVDALDNLTKGTVEYTTALVEANKAAKELIDSNAYLQDKYKIVDGQIVVDEEALNRIKEQQNQEIVDNLLKQNLTQIKIDAQNYKNTYESEKSKLENEYINNTSTPLNPTDPYSLEKQVTKSLTPVTVGEFSDDQQKIIDDAENTMLFGIAEEISSLYSGMGDDFYNELSSNVQTALAGLKAKDLAENLKTDKNYIDNLVNEKLQNYNKLTDSDKQRYAELTKTEYQGGNTFSGEAVNVNEIKEYLAQIDAYNELLKIDPETQQSLDKISGFFDKLKSIAGTDIATDLNGILSGADKVFSNITSEEQKDQIRNYFENLDQATLDAMAEAYNVESGKIVKTVIENALDKTLIKEIQSNLAAKITELTESVATISAISEALGDGKAISDLTDEQQQFLDTLEEKYEILADLKDYDVSLYQEALEAIQDIQQREKISLLNQDYENQLKEFEEKYGELTVDVTLDNLDEVTDELEDLLNQDYKIQIEVDSNLNTITEDIVDEIDKIADAASLIGENYIVASGNVATLAKVFPEVVDAAYKANGEMEDGSLQLNQALVDQAFEAANKQVEISRNEQIDKLQLEADSVKAREEAAEVAKDAWQKYADAEGKSAIELEGIKQQALEATNNFNELCKSDAIQTSADYNVDEIDLNNQLDDSNLELAQNVANYSEKGYNSALKIQGEYTKKVIENNNKIAESTKNAADGKTTTASGISTTLGVTSDTINKNSDNESLKNVITGGFSNKDYYFNNGTTVKDKLESNLEQLQQSIKDYSEAQEAQNQANYYGAYAKSMQEQYANLIAQIAKLKENSSNLSNTITNLGKSDDDGSGSDSGSDSADTAKENELLEEQADIFHDIDIKIEKLTTSFKRLQTAQKKLFGKELIDNLNEQLSIIQQQKQAYQEKINLANQEAQKQKEILAGYGVQFDASGQISNYTEAFNANLAYTNGVISAANAAGTDDGVDDAKQRFEDFKSALEDYEDLINNTIPDLEDDIQSAIDDQIELQISKFKMEFEIRLDMQSAEKDWNEFYKKVVDKVEDDDYLGIIKYQLKDIESYFNTFGTGTGSIQSLTKQLDLTLGALQQIDQGIWSSAYGDDKAQGMEDLKDTLESLQDQLMELEDLIDDVEETYLSAIDKVNDAFEDQIAQYELLNDMLTHNKNVIELIYGDTAYESLSKYYDQQEQANLRQLDFLRQEADYWQQKMDAEEEGSEAWKKYKENWESAIKNLNSLVEDSIQNLIDKYENAVEDVFAKMEKALTNNKGLDFLNDQWDLMTKNADAYYDTIDRAYQMQKLQNKFTDALNNNTGIKAQQQIKELMDEQLASLEAKDKLNAKDVERAELMLDIELKRIALEEAQQSKTKMRLKRDSQGNYSYQFVSDEDQLAQAQQELLDAQNSLYNFDKDRLKENYNNILSEFSEFTTQMKELQLDMSLTVEEREEKRMELMEEWQERFTGLVSENATVRQDLEQSLNDSFLDLYDQNLDNFNAMAEAEILGWNSTVQDMIDAFTGGGNGAEGFLTACENAFDQLDNITKDYESSLIQLEDTGRISFDGINSGIYDNIDAINNMIDRTEEVISQYNRELSAVQQVRDSVSSLADQYARVKEEAIAASSAAMKYWQEEQARAAAEAAKQNEAIAAEQGKNTSSGSSGSSSNSGVASGQQATLDNIYIGQQLRYTGGTYYYTSDGANPIGSRGAGGVVTVENINKNGAYKVAVKSNNSAYGWLNPNQLQYLDTGGYTGEWGDSGKLAVLHQKELILNATDTDNILTAVSLVRDMAKLINSKTMDDMSKMLSSAIVPTYSNGAYDKDGEVIQQEVNIQVTLPNVTNKNEVEEALLNLVNTASQYALKNK